MYQLAGRDWPVFEEGEVKSGYKSLIPVAQIEDCPPFSPNPSLLHKPRRRTPQAVIDRPAKITFGQWPGNYA